MEYDIHLYFLFCLWNIRGLCGYCRFPHGLWRRSPVVTERIWFTSTKYLANGEDWESRKQVVAQETKLIISTQYPWTCADQSQNKRCTRTEPYQQLHCVESEGMGKYRVKQLMKGVLKFVCYRFLIRNKNIIQVWRSKENDTNEASLCEDAALSRNEWPWIAESRQEWSACPIVGGYDFVSYVNERKRRLCHRVWRPSRLESECILGEGMQIEFPERSCSFFPDRIQVVNLQCWGAWEEEWYTFIVAGEEGQIPQHIMRIPNPLTASTMNMHMYFSLVAPLNDRGIPPGDVMHIELHMKRSEAGTCYDESELCTHFASEGKCTKEGLQRYGTYCKRSCGLCSLVPSTTTECDFPLQYQGEWLLFERDRKETVNLSYGKVTFDKLGHFLCKSKHWSQELYKFLSVYNNGCRPRYTCMEFKHDEKENFLQYRISRSSRIDNSFKLCQFQSDPPPLKNSIRSEDMKILFPISRTQLKTCGLGGLLHLQATFTDGHSCRGSLSDWNPFSCAVSPKLALGFRSCKDGMAQSHSDFTCEAFIDMTDNYRILVTREDVVDSNIPKYSCWIIFMSDNKSNSSGTIRKWKLAYMLKRAQCGLPGDLDPNIYKPAEVVFQIYLEPVEKHCIDFINKSSTQYSATTRYTVRKYPKDLRTSMKHFAKESSMSDPASISKTTKIFLFLFALSQHIIIQGYVIH